MKKVFLLILLCIGVNCALDAKHHKEPVQLVESTNVEIVSEDQDDSNRVFNKVELKAEFPGERVGLMNYLRDNLKYPQEVLADSVQGVVMVKFVVTNNGVVKDIKVMRSVHKSLDKEAVRVVRMMPNWTPAQLHGKNVSSWVTLPIRFRLPQQDSTAPSE